MAKLLVLVCNKLELDTLWALRHNGETVIFSDIFTSNYKGFKIPKIWIKVQVSDLILY